MESKKSYQFMVDRSEFLESLDTVYPVCKGKVTIPILSNILIQIESDPSEPDANGTGSYSITGTDLEVALQSSGSCDPGQNEKFSFTVNCKQLRDTLKAMDSKTVIFTGTGNDMVRITDTSGADDFTLHTLPVDDFPLVPAPDKAFDTEIDKGVLLTCLDKTFFSIPTTDTRYALLGALFEFSKDRLGHAHPPGTLKIVSTDTHRLSFVETSEGNFSHSFKAIIPRECLRHLMTVCKKKSFKSSSAVCVTAHFETVTKSVDPKTKIKTTAQEARHIYFRIGNLLMISRVLEGEFPDYRRILKDGSGDIEASFNVDTSLKALKKVAVFASERTHGVNLSVNDDHIIFKTDNPQTGKARVKVPAAIIGNNGNGNGKIEVRYNGPYLTEFLKVTSGEKTTLSIYGESLRGIFKESQPVRFEHTIMPMRD